MLPFFLVIKVILSDQVRQSDHWSNRRGASNKIIHYEVTGLLIAVWKFILSELSELAREEGGGGVGLITHMRIVHMRDIEESAGSRQLDR